jgi:hypothetical protein
VRKALFGGAASQSKPPAAAATSTPEATHSPASDPPRLNTGGTRFRTFLVGVALFAAGALAVYYADRRQRTELDSTGISPSPGFIYSDTITGTIIRASAPKDVGEQITFIGLSTASPRVAYSGTGSTSPMKILGETDGLITLQLYTGHSLDTFIIDKKTGLFSRAFSGTSFGAYAGGAIGTCR